MLTAVMNTHDTLSSVLGWVSIACWVIVYAPQIIENYQLKSGEGLSVTFVVVWLLGDLCNLGGAVMAHLLSTIIILAVYYSLCDVILLFQIYYYRRISSPTPDTPVSVPNVAHSADVGEEEPLLPGNDQVAAKRAEGSSLRTSFLKYVGALLVVFATGVVAWWVSERFIKHEQSPKRPDDTLEWRSQVLGYTSAILYLGARIPQIFKNLETKCEGLSPFLFLFSITGNATYVLSICAASMDAKYLLKNASWLAGSGLTIFLDVFVLCQFLYYRSKERGAGSTRGGP